MEFENSVIEGINNTQWEGNYSKGIVIDNSGQGYETYNCLQCQNQVYFINGSDAYPGGVTSNRVIEARQDYRYGNYFRYNETCTKNCVTGCFNQVVDASKTETISPYWVNYAIGSYVNTRAVYNTLCEQDFINTITRNIFVCQDSRVSTTWEVIPYIQCLGDTAGTYDRYTVEIKSDYNIAKRENVNPCPTGYVGQYPGANGWVNRVPVPKHLYECYRVVSCGSGVTPLIGTELSTLYRITQDGYVFDDPTFYVSIGTDVTCTNYNGSAGSQGMAGWSYTSVGTGYCDSCFGCNAGCTIACVGCYSNTVFTEPY
jgi:hypothetical protein